MRLYGYNDTGYIIVGEAGNSHSGNWHHDGNNKNGGNGGSSTANTTTSDAMSIVLDSITSKGKKKKKKGRKGKHKKKEKVKKSPVYTPSITSIATQKAKVAQVLGDELYSAYLSMKKSNGG